MSTLYKISSLIALVMASPNNFAQIIGILSKGTLIDVISLSGNWAYFKYNNSNAYVKKNNLKIVDNPPVEIKGSIILKYLDNNNNEIYSSETISNLSLGTYSYEAKNIYGYKLSNTSPQSVTLTEANPNQTITFLYNKVLGSITIKYIDENTNNEIYTSTLINNLELGSYTYGFIDIDGYILSDNESKTVTLTQDNPNVSITFKYNEILGTVTIKYVSSETLEELSPTEVISNLHLGTYSFEAKDIDCYDLKSASKISVALTDINPNATIVFEYSEILGNITVKYVDAVSSMELAETKILSNKPLGKYTLDAISINGYIPIEAKKSIDLTCPQSNVDTVFEYNEILGSVTINYIDKDSKEPIADSKVYSNLKLGTYSYSAIEIENFNIYTTTLQSVTLTIESPTATITFKYSKAKIEVPEDFNWNEVPYISTYYIKPVVEPGEEVFIDYYITDYYYKEYMEKYNLKEDTWGDDNWTEEVWNNETFTVTVKVEGKKDKLYHNLKAGDHKVSLGIFNTEGEQKFSILCTDKYDRNSHELFNFFLVRKPVVCNEYVMTKEDLTKYNIKNTDTYEVKKIVNLSALTTKTSATIKAALIEEAKKIIPESKTYVCVIADTTGDGTPDNWWAENQVVYASDYDADAVLQEATNTRIGLQKLLDDKKAEGYNKLTLLKGTYRIDHQLQIYIPTEFTLNMNGATLKQNQFIGNKSLMMELNNTFDSHVINGTIEGDYFSHDYVNSTNNSEWINGINIGGEAKYSSFENLTIKDITGYGSSNGIANSRDGKLGYTYLSPRAMGNVFKLGDIDRNTGLDIESTTRTTSGFRDISGYENIGYLSVSIYLGYQGNPCGTWNLICHFYDQSKKFIKSIDSYQYRRIGIPKNSKYMRITILNESYPTNLSIQYFRIPTHCSFNNIKHENCRCVGMAPAAMKDMCIKSCEFTNCGQSSAKCALDAEDGWDSMQDITFKDLKFNSNPNNHFLTCAGHNFIIDGQTGGQLYMWERTRSPIIKNCINVNLSIQSGGKNAIVRHGVYRVYNNNFTFGKSVANLIKNNYCIGYLSGIITNSTVGSLSNCDNSIYKKCTINISSDFLGYLSNITMSDCNFIPYNNFNGRYRLSFNKGHLNSYTFTNCNFQGKSSLSNHNGFFCGSFINCNFHDVNIYPNITANSDDIIYFKNCNINYSQNNLIYYSPSSGTTPASTKLLFIGCNIKNLDNNSKPFIYANAKPNGYCTFNNCTISIPDNLTILDAYKTYLDLINDYNLTFNNSPLPSNVVLLSDILKNNSNIKISIN